MSLQSSLHAANPLYHVLDSIASTYRAGASLPEVWSSPYFGDMGITGPHEDGEYPDEGEYIRVGFTLPDGVYAEVDDATYGNLQCFRIYKDELE